MKKDSQVKLGSTCCDYCQRPSTRAIGKLIVCDVHAYRATHEGTKVASAQAETLRSAAVTFQDQHQ